MTEMKILSGMGFCKICKQELIDVNGVKCCLDCKGENNPSSGLVNAIKDPGHDVTQDLLRRNGIETADNKNSEQKSDTKSITPIIGANEVSVTVSLEELEAMDIKDLVFKRLNEALDELPCPRMKDAKRIMKIQEKLEVK